MKKKVKPPILGITLLRATTLLKEAMTFIDPAKFRTVNALTRGEELRAEAQRADEKDLLIRKTREFLAPKAPKWTA